MFNMYSKKLSLVIIYSKDKGVDQSGKEIRQGGNGEMTKLGGMTKLERRG